MKKLTVIIALILLMSISACSFFRMARLIMWKIRMTTIQLPYILRIIGQWELYLIIWKSMVNMQQI